MNLLLGITLNRKVNYVRFICRTKDSTVFSDVNINKDTIVHRYNDAIDVLSIILILIGLFMMGISFYIKPEVLLMKLK